MGGDLLGSTPVYVPPLPGGHSTTVTVKLIAPSSSGTYRGFFHLLTDRGDQVGGMYKNLFTVTVNHASFSLSNWSVENLQEHMFFILNS